MEDKESKMKKLLLIPLLLFCFTAFGQFTKPQLYTNINTNIRLKTYSPTRMASLLDSLVATMGSGSGMVYPGVGIPLSTGSAWGTSITDNSANWNTAFGWGNHASAGYQSALTFSNGLTESAGNVTATGDAPYINFYNTTGADSYNYELSPTTFRNQVINGSLETVITQTKNEFTIEGISGANRYAINVNGANGISFDFPTNATGDTYHRGSSTYYSRLPIGGSGQVYTVGGSSVPIWEDFSTLFSSNFDYSLASDGDVFTISGGIPAWVTPSSGGLDVGTTAITSGTDTRILYNNAGTLGEYTVSGSGNVAMTTSPTFTTPILGTPTSGTLTNATGYLFNNLAAATGSNTINNAANAQEWQWNTLGAGTGLLLSSSSTAAASNTNTVFRVNQTGANATSTQTTYGGYFSNTKTGTSSTNIGAYFNASGGSTNYAAYIDGGELKFASGGTIANTTGNLTMSSAVNFSNGQVTLSGSRQIIFNGGTGEFRGDANSQIALRSNYSTGTTVPFRFYNGNGNYSATSGTLSVIGNEVSFAPTSGTAVLNAFLGSGTINQTGGANGVVSMLKLTPTYTATGGDVNALYYDPTVTSVGGVNYFLHATSGKTLIGGTTITANTYHDLRGGSSTDKILRLADGSNNELFTFKADKEYEVTQTNGKYQERQPTGTTSATVYSENIYSSSDISDGQSVTIEVLWTAKDSGANTGAGGVFYTTWTKASGTLAKAGDNQLVTNDNMTGSWALSTSDSSGSIALAFTGTGVANTEISLVTRIIKSN